MGATEKRMEQLGIQLQQTDWRGKGVVDAVLADDLLYLSAHYPVDANGEPVYVGRVGAELNEEEAYQAARLCGLNMLRTIQFYIGSLDRVDYTEPNSPVYLDSCLEVFLRPFPQKNEYLNFEMNASGALLLQIGSERKGRRFLHAEDFPGCYPEVFPFREQACWGVRLSVPTAFLQTVCEISAQPDPSDFEGNFYKCGDLPAHFLCWNPVESESPDFHRPEFFASFAPLWNESDHKN